MTIISPVPRVALRFVRTHPGTYIVVTGEATRRVRYTINWQGSHRWRAERADQVPGCGWVVSAALTVQALKAGERWCEDCARNDRALLPPEA